MSSNNSTTSGGAEQPHPVGEKILSALKQLVRAGQVVELRIPNVGGRSCTVSGYFDDLSKLAQAAAKYDGKVQGIYMTLNPVNPALLARAANKVNEWSKITTGDHEIDRRTKFWVDIDPVRPSGISATETEHQAALAMADAIDGWLLSKRWPQPIKTDSGNGAYLIYEIDLPNDEASTELLKNALYALDIHFSNEQVQIDTGVFNASHIFKVPGTMACKGDSTPDRPHRRSVILSSPEELKLVDRALLEALAAQAPNKQSGAKQDHAKGKASQETHQERAGTAWDEAIQTIKARLDILEVALRYFPGGTQDEPGGQVRILGYQGLIVKPSTGEWYIHGQQVGGDVISLVGYARYGAAWDNKGQMFLEIVRELAAEVGVDLPTASGADSANSGHTEDNASPEETSAVVIYPCTDAGNAERLMAQHGMDLHYCPDWNRWLVWDGRRWASNNDGEVLRCALATVRAIPAEAARTVAPETQIALGKHATKSESNARLKAMTELAQSLPGVPVSPDLFDTDPYLLNCQNGTLDLRTGKLRSHNRTDRLTKLVPVSYDPTAQCPMWLAFLNRIMGGNASLIAFLQRATGYSLTGDTSEQVLFLLHGAGANGKSTLVETVRMLLGDYAQIADVMSFLAPKGDRIRNDLAKLTGARFVAAAEVAGDRHWDEPLIKQLTGGDRITARFLYGEHFEFTPQFKLWIATNHKPAIQDGGYAMWRRIRLIPFLVTIPPHEQDKRLTAKLRAELPGILAWAAQGCLAWQRYGLGEPPEVGDATEAYRQETDAIAEFLTMCCEQGPDFKVGATELYLAYTGWCRDTNEPPLSQREFGKRLTDRGFRRVRTGSGNYYVGLKLACKALPPG